MAALRLIGYEQVFAILLTIPACVIVVDSLGAWLRMSLKEMPAGQLSAKATMTVPSMIAPSEGNAAFAVHQSGLPNIADAK